MYKPAEELLIVLCSRLEFGGTLLTTGRDKKGIFTSGDNISIVD